ncbi:hypothetical protein RF55_6290 [Lasius niger]|uniref:Uncharacterized protein n=1 Tax=Lasius niger TaxID=67767 RepID=A0A0J7KT85_LASNI|nr:hypothetical protein RF55_6290 [Lasius niger]
MEPTRVPRGPGPRLVFLFATLVLTFAATGLLCGAIMSDHWEEIGWDKENLIHANVNLTWYLDGQVAMLKSSVNHRTNRITKSSSFLVPMHGGIWIMCVTLSATFALFTLTIIHFKRDHGIKSVMDGGPEDGVIGMPVPRSVLKARRFTTAWSMDLGWGGVTLCALASVAWILLSKIMRFSPIAAMIA